MKVKTHKRRRRRRRRKSHCRCMYEMFFFVDRDWLERRKKRVKVCEMNSLLPSFKQKTSLVLTLKETRENEVREMISTFSR